MVYVLILIFVVIDGLVFYWMLNQLVDGVSSFTDVFSYYVLPNWFYYFLIASIEERRALRRAYGIQVLLAALICVEWWAIKRLM